MNNLLLPELLLTRHITRYMPKCRSSLASHSMSIVQNLASNTNAFIIELRSKVNQDRAMYLCILAHKVLVKFREQHSRCIIKQIEESDQPLTLADLSGILFSVVADTQQLHHRLFNYYYSCCDDAYSENMGKGIDPFALALVFVSIFVKNCYHVRCCEADNCPYQD